MEYFGYIKISADRLLVLLNDLLDLVKLESGKMVMNFQQSSATEIGTTKGTGLGLPICKEIIELHHGKIWAENRQYGGAIFSFMIPVEQA